LAAARKGIIYQDKQLKVSRTVSPPGLRFVGEIDASNASAVAQVLAGADLPGGNVHVDVSGLSFIDLSGIKAIVAASESLGAGRRLLLHGLPAQLARAMTAVGWTEQRYLAICDCGAVVA
jgi:anti-anti-sigma factor